MRRAAYLRRTAARHGCRTGAGTARREAEHWRHRQEWADRLCALAPAHASDVRGEAARLIVEVAPDALGHVLFTTGATEAIEHAGLT
jgi:hypothetical protein